ncbi:hypothetical protein [Empedobacter falsenii]
MIDNISIIKKTLSDNELKNIIVKAELQKIVIGANCTYNNFHLKNLSALKVQITANRSLKIVCSLHKVYNHFEIGKQVNYTDFTMIDAQQTLIKLIDDLGILKTGILITSYEVGLNLSVKSDCKNYLNKYLKIGKIGKEKLFYVNPKYKDERCITTIIHRDLRKSFKVYDKGFEMLDKKRKEYLKNPVLRLETTFKRCENLSLIKFIDSENLNKIQSQFFEDWKSVKYKRELIVPKGTNKDKTKLCYDLIYKGIKETEESIKSLFDSEIITLRQYRYYLNFIQNEWNEFKLKLLLKASKEELEMLQLLKIEYK